jgi:hypothetical protein
VYNQNFVCVVRGCQLNFDGSIFNPKRPTILRSIFYEVNSELKETRGPSNLGLNGKCVTFLHEVCICARSKDNHLHCSYFLFISFNGIPQMH